MFIWSVSSGARLCGLWDCVEGELDARTTGRIRRQYIHFKALVSRSDAGERLQTDPIGMLSLEFYEGSDTSLQTPSDDLEDNHWHREKECP
jgi:hypothetical protein